MGFIAECGGMWPKQDGGKSGVEGLDGWTRAPGHVGSPRPAPWALRRGASGV